MRQMLLRVPDELHARVTRTAREHHTSVNALATQILDEAVPRTAADERVRLREKARKLGLLAERPPRSGPPPSDEEWLRALSSTKGLGPVLDKIFEDAR